MYGQIDENLMFMKIRAAVTVKYLYGFLVETEIKITKCGVCSFSETNQFDDIIPSNKKLPKVVFYLCALVGLQSCTHIDGKDSLDLESGIDVGFIDYFIFKF
jgi:hypothetical protein